MDTLSYYQRINREELSQALRLFEYIKKTYNIASIIDYGAGTGLYLSPFYDAGYIVKAVELEPGVLDDRVRMIPRECFDIVDMTKYHVNKNKYNMTLCLEVLEHIPEEQSEAAIEQILKTAGDTIIFSAAAPGQGGDGHINCRPVEYWIEKFSSTGQSFPHYDERETRDLIDFMKSGYHMGWFIQNCLVFHNHKL